ncbi:hypothetical protein TUBRATIS_006670 [Tubulinosema ratisbonensis]|uniref:Uncharacterized protein n=1 Tax=Tubulinosema ratisbonensis TaxID=291195 RepID=A0A437ANR7_9MICR|nr:hypothetical protein TUBRATIS_006670 [Tubulinosema ratisbonensis]
MNCISQRKRKKFVNNRHQNDPLIYEQNIKGNNLIKNITNIDNFLIMFLLLFLSNRILHICAYWKIAVLYFPFLLLIYFLQFLILKFRTFKILSISELQCILSEFFSLFHLALNVFLLFFKLVIVCILYYKHFYKDEKKIDFINLHVAYFISYFFTILFLIHSIFYKIKIYIESAKPIYYLGCLLYIIISSGVIFISYNCGDVFIIAIVFSILIAVFIFCKIIAIKNIICDPVMKEVMFFYSGRAIFLINFLFSRFYLELCLVLFSPKLYFSHFLLEKEYYILCKNSLMQSSKN